MLLELDPKYQEQADSLQTIAFKTPAGALVPLQSVVTPQETVGPQTVNHVGELPAVSISFGLRPGVSLGAAVDHINRVAAGLLPATVTTTSGIGEDVPAVDDQPRPAALHRHRRRLHRAGHAVQSYIHPLTILSGLPSAGLGALVTLYLFGNELNIYSFVGLVMLVGIVKKNAIMQIDFALEAERQHGKSPADAIYEGAVVYFHKLFHRNVDFQVFFDIP